MRKYPATPAVREAIQPPRPVRRATGRTGTHAAGQPLQGPCPVDPDIMDIEQINAIGNALTDLQARTNALRGYL